MLFNFQEVFTTPFSLHGFNCFLRNLYLSCHVTLAWRSVVQRLESYWLARRPMLSLPLFQNEALWKTFDLKGFHAKTRFAQKWKAIRQWKIVRGKRNSISYYLVLYPIQPRYRSPLVHGSTADYLATQGTPLGHSWPPSKLETITKGYCICLCKGRTGRIYTKHKNTTLRRYRMNIHRNSKIFAVPLSTPGRSGLKRPLGALNYPDGQR